MLQGIRKIHFIGVGGAGMSALARILLDKGYVVSGSDRKMSATAEQLAAFVRDHPEAPQGTWLHAGFSLGIQRVQRDVYFRPGEREEDG